MLLFQNNYPYWKWRLKQQKVTKSNQQKMQKNGHPFTNKTKIRFILNRQEILSCNRTIPRFLIRIGEICSRIVNSEIFCQILAPYCKKTLSYKEWLFIHSFWNVTIVKCSLIYNSWIKLKIGLLIVLLWN